MLKSDGDVLGTGRAAMARSRQGLRKGVVSMSEGPEEKSRSSSHKGLALFEKGNEAALRNNHDYAIEMYLKALKEEPGNLDYRPGFAPPNESGSTTTRPRSAGEPRPRSR